MTSDASSNPVGTGMQMIPYVGDKLTDLYNRASEPGDTQKSVQAAIRSTVGIAAIYFSPGAAVVGALAASYKPELVTSGCRYAEGAITGFWDRLPFKVKVLLPAAGITALALYDPTTVFRCLSTVFALKLGAELGVRNFTKETRAAAVKQLEAEHPVEE